MKRPGAPCLDVRDATGSINGAAVTAVPGERKTEVKTAAIVIPVGVSSRCTPLSLVEVVSVEQVPTTVDFTVSDSVTTLRATYEGVAVTARFVLEDDALARRGEPFTVRVETTTGSPVPASALQGVVFARQVSSRFTRTGYPTVVVLRDGLVQVRPLPPTNEGETITLEAPLELQVPPSFCTPGLTCAPLRVEVPLADFKVFISGR